ncbi:MAG TPA: peptidyl-prolyl cis-trans isomerase [Terriglobales bacterium]|nr:peptidyl-prolyl cis-trans isomerase [Terriglobales bacterium]
MIRFLQTPGPIKKIVLGGLLTIICVFMVITLVPGFGSADFLGGGSPQRGIVATVGDQQVTASEVQRQARAMLEQQFPRGGAQASMLLPYFAQRAADQLISEKAMLAEAQRLGLRATDDEVREELQKNPNLAPTFFPGGTFIGQDKYEQLLQQHDLTVPQFEQELRDQVLFNKLRNLIAGSASVTDAEVRQEFEKQNTKVKFEYAVLKKDDILKEIHPSDAELKAFYDRNKATYNNSIPEKRQIKYFVLDTNKLQAQTPVTQEELQSYYDQHRDEFRVPEQVNVRHILIKTNLTPDGKVDPKAADEARKKAEDILKQLKAGGNFEELAKKYSEDPGSAKNGGSLGWIGKGRTVPEFEKAAFSLPKGGTSDLVQSSYGFHIIHVDDKQDAHMKSLAEVKDQIEPLVRLNKAQKAAQSEASALLTQARSQGIDKAAAAKGLQLVTTDFVSKTDSLPGIGNSPSFMESVFGEPDKSAPDEAQLPQGYAIFQVQAIKPPATPTFEEIRSRIESEFKNERSAQLLTQKTKELSDRAKADHDLKKAAKELGATVKTSDFVAPDGQVPDIGSMTGPASVAFTLKPGEVSGPIDSGNTGAVLNVLEKQQPTDQDFATKKDQIRDSLLQAKQGELFGMFATNLREQMEKSKKIKINQDEMKTLTRGSIGEQGE